MNNEVAKELTVFLDLRLKGLDEIEKSIKGVLEYEKRQINDLKRILKEGYERP